MDCNTSVYLHGTQMLILISFAFFLHYFFILLNIVTVSNSDQSTVVEAGLLLFAFSIQNQLKRMIYLVFVLKDRSFDFCVRNPTKKKEYKTPTFHFRYQKYFNSSLSQSSFMLYFHFQYESVQGMQWYK